MICKTYQAQRNFNYSIKLLYNGANIFTLSKTGLMSKAVCELLLSALMAPMFAYMRSYESPTNYFVKHFGIICLWIVWYKANTFLFSNIGSCWELKNYKYFLFCLSTRYIKLIINPFLDPFLEWCSCTRHKDLSKEDGQFGSMKHIKQKNSIFILYN